MPTEAEDRLIALLMVQREALGAAVFAQMLREVPGYDRLDPVRLRAQNLHSVDTVIRTLAERNPALASHYVDELTAQRLAEGVPITVFLVAVQVVETVIRAAIRAGLADDPPAAAHALHRVDRAFSLVRNVVGRRNLTNVMQPPGSDPATHR